MKKKIIIMGATSGIGLEVARLFHQQGHIIAIAGRRMDNLQRISTELANCPYAQIDVTDTQAPTRLQELIEDLGGMDIYLHVSGIGKQNRQLDTDVELATVETNALGFTRLVNHAWHYFRTQDSGHIAAVSSIAGTKGLGATPSYSATKRYCNTYLEALAQLANMQGLNIHFTDIRPGFVNTELLSDSFHYPMMMQPVPVAHQIVKGILSRKRTVTIDWRFRLLVFFWRLIPSCLWVRLKVG
ncbi:MAG: SDR family NAD(P)-dependent oxidoreductase [Bacteroidaceae bacterium]|nr:SDR family NAD(P)-dependent oxidoreductase [Bacteroidaceae bacterium]